MKNLIIVTGGAGFVGSNLIEYLLKKTNLKILSIDNYSSGSKKNHIKNKNVKYIKADVNDIEKILNKQKKDINVIFHFGEFARIHQSFINTEECFHTNISGTSKVFSFCLKNKIKIIYSATSASLGNNGKDQNLSPYAFTKSKNLKLLIHLKRWFDLKFEVLYFYNVYGPKQIEEGPMATVIGIFEKQYRNNKRLTITRPGTQSRKFTHIEDTVKGCFYAWKKSLNRHYLLSNTKSYTILEVAKIFGRKVKFVRSRLGERKKSSLVNKIGEIKTHSIPCKLSLKQYIQNIKFKHK
jgi:UDP-glucose 4-epimerase